MHFRKNVHTSQKTPPGTDPPPDSHNASSHSASASVFFDDICSKNEVDHAKERKNLRQEVLGCSCGCRKRKNDDLQRARPGGGQPCAHKEAQQARTMQGRAGKGRLAHLSRMQILLTSLSNEDVTYAGGVVLKNTIASDCLPTCDSQARIRTAVSNIHRAATALAPLPFQKPLDNPILPESTRDGDIESRRPGFCRPSTAPTRPVVGGEV